jgi:hypothetical protein
LTISWNSSKCRSTFMMILFWSWELTVPEPSMSFHFTPQYRFSFFLFVLLIKA